MDPWILPGITHDCCMGCPSELAAMLPHDFGIETRGNALILNKERQCSFGRENFTSCKSNYHTACALDQYNKDFHCSLSHSIY